jgi:Chs5-Arf1p-binding protein BUD7/BCH1
LQTDVALQRLPAPSLKGTFARAYAILAKLVSLVGWDELLKSRSTVFVMEEEYRMQKAQTDIRAAGLDGDLPNGRVIYEDGTVRKQSADDNASTKGMVTPPNASPEQTRRPLSPPEIPTIKVSSESDRDRELAEMEREKERKEEAEETEQSIRPSGEPNSVVDTLERAAEGLEKPSQAAASDDSKETKKDGALPEHQESEGFSFANKRLCERWLDNLFMCLYEVTF